METVYQNMECTFCKKKFSTKGNLEIHQKTTKYCLEIQGKYSNVIFKCEHCNKNFTSHQNQINHACEKNQKKLKENQLVEERRKEEENIIIKKCSEKFELQLQHLKEKLAEKDMLHQKDIKEKNEYIAKLEARLDKFENVITSMAAEPKNSTKTTNVIVNNHTLNLSTEHVSKVLDEHFTKEVVANGQKGLAKMVCEKMLTGPDGKLSYKCVDPSRHTFEFVNDDGDIERDIKAKKLTKALINSNIQQKAAEVGNTIWTKDDGHVDSDKYNYCSQKVLELACLEKDDSKFRSELSALTS